MLTDEDGFLTVEHLEVGCEKENNMIETVVVLLMFVNGEIKEQSYPKTTWQNVHVERDKQKEITVPCVKYQCWKGKGQVEIYMGEKSIKAIILE